MKRSHQEAVESKMLHLLMMRERRERQLARQPSWGWNWRHNFSLHPKGQRRKKPPKHV